MISLKNLDECSKFLWGEPGGDKVRRLVDRLIEFFHVEKGNLRPIIVSAASVHGERGPAPPPPPPPIIVSAASMHGGGGPAPPPPPPPPPIIAAPSQ